MGTKISQAFQQVADRLRENKLEYSVVFAVFVFGFLFYLLVLLKNELVPMIDGPYYLIQVRSLLNTGGLVYGDPPLTFYLMSLTSVLVGDVSLGVKVGVSLFSALSTVPAYFLMKKVAKTSFAGLTAMLFIVFSAPYIRTLVDFMKNAIGVCWLFAFLYYLHDLAFSGPKKSNITLAMFFLLLTGLTHILTFGIALLFLAFYAVASLIFGVNRKQFLKSVGILFVGVCIFILVASVFFGDLFTDFSKAASFINEILQFQTLQPQTALATNMVPRVRPRPATSGLGVFSLSAVGGWETVAMILFVGATLSVYSWKKQQKEALLLLSAATIIGVVVSFPLLPADLLGRFLLMMVIPTTVIISYAVGKVWTLASRDTKLVALVLLGVCTIFFAGQCFRTIEVIRPSIPIDGYNDLVDMKDMVPSDSVILASRGAGLGYWVEYVEDVDILGVHELSPQLWQTYSRVLGIFPKGQVPIMIPHKTLGAGSVYVLVEILQRPVRPPIQ
ncbi:MAG: hypothetical protein CW716_02090 [Candidatus Bathyarchaeum sp.]|nr:MAG: hypothetical protein CW716_02090 [Candidatus Bathyarchaeum sp.]